MVANLVTQTKIADQKFQELGTQMHAMKTEWSNSGVVHEAKQQIHEALQQQFLAEKDAILATIQVSAKAEAEKIVMEAYGAMRHEAEKLAGQAKIVVEQTVNLQGTEFAKRAHGITTSCLGRISAQASLAQGRNAFGAPMDGRVAGRGFPPGQPSMFEGVPPLPNIHAQGGPPPWPAAHV